MLTIDGVRYMILISLWFNKNFCLSFIELCFSCILCEPIKRCSWWYDPHSLTHSPTHSFQRQPQCYYSKWVLTRKLISAPQTNLQRACCDSLKSDPPECLWESKTKRTRGEWWRHRGKTDEGKSGWKAAGRLWQTSRMQGWKRLAEKQEAVERLVVVRWQGRSSRNERPCGLIMNEKESVSIR